jgi:putative endonuclease
MTNGRQHNYWVYLMASKTGVLYVGMTNDLQRQVWEHKSKEIPGFTADYNANRLVWFEEFRAARDAIETEKRIKGWARAKKVKLIAEKNSNWIDFADDWLRRCGARDEV